MSSSQASENSVLITGTMAAIIARGYRARRPVTLQTLVANFSLRQIRDHLEDAYALVEADLKDPRMVTSIDDVFAGQH